MHKGYVLITGASSGLGVDFAKIFAKKGYNLILTARREQNLQDLKTDILNSSDIDIHIVPTDLSQISGVEALVSYIEEQKLPLTALVNNAGVGCFGEFETQEWEAVYSMMNLNMQSLTLLTQKCIPHLKKSSNAYILMVSSVAGFTPCPYYASYAATKSYVTSFAMALRKELEETDISISILCPGSTETSFHHVSGRKHNDSVKGLMMKSDIVANMGVNGMFKKKAIITPGWFNKLSAIINRFLPRTMMVSLAHKIMKGKE